MTASQLRLGLVAPSDEHAALLARLAASGLALVDGLDADAVLALGPEHGERVLTAAERGTPVLLVGTDHSAALWDAAGLLLCRVLPVHEVLVRPGRDAGEVALCLSGDELLVLVAWHLLV